VHVAHALLRAALALMPTVPLGNRSWSSQWLNYPTAHVPRLRNGYPNLSAPTPRTKDGKPVDRSVRFAD